MKMFVSVVCAMSVLVVLSGCGGSTDEVPALSAPGSESTPEENQKWMEESMKYGGAPEGYKPDADKKQ